MDVITVGRALLELAAGNHRGIFHLAGHSRVSRFEMAQTIARSVRVSPGPDSATRARPQPRAGRPDRGTFPSTTAKACAQLKTPMRTLDEGLSLILETANRDDFMSTPKIKFDLQIKYGSEYGPEEEQALLEVLRQGAPTSGEACIQFEKRLRGLLRHRPRPRGQQRHGRPVPVAGGAWTSNPATAS